MRPLVAMSEGLRQAQLDEMTVAITEECMEAWYESAWTQ